MSDEPTTAPTSGPDAATIAGEISGMIAKQSLRPGERIGAERELAERFGVSRWLVRKGLEQLEMDGRILRTNGRNGGVFVAPVRVVRDLTDLVGLPEYLRAQGLAAGTTVMGTRAGPADDDSIKHLGLSADAWVIEIDRLRLAEGLPLSVEKCRFPAELFPGLLDHSLVGSLYDLLEKEYRIERGEAVETITARAADRSQASALQVPVGTALLEVNRTAELITGQIFEYSTELYRSDRVAIAVHTAGGHHPKRHLVPSKSR